MTSKYWIKLYHEILADPKMMRMDEVVFGRCIKIFLLAGQTNDGGYLPCTEDIAWHLRLSDQEIAATLAELERVNILVREDGRWLVRRFAARNEAMPPAEKMRYYRQEQKSQEYHGEPLPASDEPVTNPVTFSNTESDIDIDKNLKSPSGDAGAKAHPNPEKKGDALDGMLKYANRGEIDLSDFPEDVREVIQAYCELYSQYPPRKSKKGEFALWIADARDLLNAGGAMTIPTMRDLKEKPYKWMGEAMIGRPGALVKAVRARAGEVSAKPISDMTSEEYVKYVLEKEKRNAGNSLPT